MDESYQDLYAAENRIATLSQYFATIAILVSCLGLLGLAAFTAERRVREIGIRKVLGASELGVMKLLSWDFAKMVLAAIAIALPLSYYLTKTWLGGLCLPGRLGMVVLYRDGNPDDADRFTDRELAGYQGGDGKPGR